MGISPQDIMQAVQTQQQMTPAGMIETQTDNVYLRLSGQFADVDMLKENAYQWLGQNFAFGRYSQSRT